MKVLLINHFPLAGSGSGVYTMNIAKSLKSKGHDVCVIMPEVTTSFEQEQGIKYHPVYFNGGEVIEGQLPFNFPCFTTHPHSVNNFFDLTDEEIKQYIEKFREAIREEVETFEPDLIHGQHIWILSDLATEYNIPLVITAHGTDIIGHQRSERFHSFTNHAAKVCKKIITISEDNKNLVEQLFPGTEHKTQLIRNGYDANIFYPDEYNRELVLKSFGIDKNYEKVVCFVGKLTDIKGVDTLLRAAQLYEDGNTATLIAGNGELYQDLTKMAQDLNLQDVYFLGNLPQAKLREIYNISDVSTVPSRFEAFGLVAIEALACGTPVIASECGGIPDFLKPDVGILIEIDDYEKLANSVKKILHQDINFDHKHIARYAYDNYAQETLIDNLIDIYESLIPEDVKKNNKINILK